MKSISKITSAAELEQEELAIVGGALPRRQRCRIRNSGGGSCSYCGEAHQ